MPRGIPLSGRRESAISRATINRVCKTCEKGNRKSFIVGDTCLTCRRMNKKAKIIAK